MNIASTNICTFLFWNGKKKTVVLVQISRLWYKINMMDLQAKTVKHSKPAALHIHIIPVAKTGDAAKLFLLQKQLLLIKQMHPPQGQLQKSFNLRQNVIFFNKLIFICHYQNISCGMCPHFSAWQPPTCSLTSGDLAGIWLISLV